MKKFILFIALFVSSTIAVSQPIYIMGGDNHEVFLGILNASPHTQNSIWNKFGTYGNKYNRDCIWNKFGTYGNSYNRYCPWNQYSCDVPILIDDAGNYYGPFSVSNSNKVIQYICKIASVIQDGDIDLEDVYELLFK